MAPFREIDLRVDRMYKVWVTYLEIYNEVTALPPPTASLGRSVPLSPRRRSYLPFPRADDV